MKSIVLKIHNNYVTIRIVREILLSDSLGRKNRHRKITAALLGDLGVP
jgi:hypothetical protein